MNTEQQQQAKNLYFQTDLTKTQIANLLNISRRSLHYWIRENNWQRLKLSATHLPDILAENCYLLISQYQHHLLSEDRIMRPITHIEAEALHKLTLTVKKLKNYSTLNERMQMFGSFMERVSKKSPELAQELAPLVDEYIEDWGRVSLQQFKPDNLNSIGFFPAPEHHLYTRDGEGKTEALKENNLDNFDLIAWEDEQELKQQQEGPVILSPTEGHEEKKRRKRLIDDKKLRTCARSAQF